MVVPESLAAIAMTGKSAMHAARELRIGASGILASSSRFPFRYHNRSSILEASSTRFKSQ